MYLLACVSKFNGLSSFNSSGGSNHSSDMILYLVIQAG